MANSKERKLSDRELMAKYLSPEIMAEILSQPEAIKIAFSKHINQSLEEAFPNGMKALYEWIEKNPEKYARFEELVKSPIDKSNTDALEERAKELMEIMSDLPVHPEFETYTNRSG